MTRQRLSLFSLLLCSALSACIDSDPMAVKQSGPQPQFAIPANWNERIRIGVVPTASTVNIGSSGDYTIRAKTSGAVLMTGSNGTVAVTLTSPSVTKWYVQVSCSSGAGLAAILAKATADGHPITTEVAASGCTRVLLGDFLLSVSFTIRNNFRLLLLSQGYPIDLFPTTRVVSVPTYRLARGATIVTSTQPPVLTSSTGIVTINGVQYRDAAEVIANGQQGGVAGVNELHIEQYLYGVVPRELGPIAFPEVEAQKAQAVAARTYALAGLGKRNAEGFDLYATTTDQVYGGYSAEHPVSSAAVDGTRGVALTYNGVLISALYSSATGGHSANSEEAFAGVTPYLRGVPDAERGEALEHVPSLEVFKAHRDPRSLRAAREGDFESNWSSRHNWTFDWSAAEIRDVLSAWKGFDVGVVSAINVLERGPSGRVLLIEYVTEAGTFTHTKDAIRSSLRYLAAGNVKTNLPSTLFFVEAVAGPHDGDVGFAVYGAGFGHGVGLGQTGAVGMAEKGHSYDEILHHYYTDVELTQAY
jgi:stage II sporulation protein D